MSKKEYFLKALAEVGAGKSFFEFFPLLCEREIRAIQTGEMLPDEFFNTPPRETSIDIGGTVYLDGVDDIPAIVDLRRPKSKEPRLYNGRWFDIIA